MHCCCAWGVKAEGEDGQPVFNIAVESVVQRPGSADCNHHRRRCVLQPSSLQTNGAAYWEQILRKNQTSTGVIQAHVWSHARENSVLAVIRQQQLQPEGWMPFKGMFNWALLILLLWGLHWGRLNPVLRSISQHKSVICSTWTLINPFTIFSRRNEHTQRKPHQNWRFLLTTWTHPPESSFRKSCSCITHAHLPLHHLYPPCASSCTFHVWKRTSVTADFTISVRKCLWHKLLLHPNWKLLLYVVPHQQV